MTTKAGKQASGREEKCKLFIYTDGACRGNPGPGGWAFFMKLETSSTKKHTVYRQDKTGNQTEGCGNEKYTTNNKMEMMAVIESLKRLGQLIEKDPAYDEDVSLYSDSQYVIKGITTWIKGWKKNGWRSATGKPVKNQELWEELDAEATKYKIDWQWVKGHSGDEYNELVDCAARAACDQVS